MLTFRELAETCRRVEQTSSTNEKVELLAELFRRASDREAHALVSLLRPQDARDSPLSRLGLGGVALIEVAEELVAGDDFQLGGSRSSRLPSALIQTGDLSDAVVQLLPERPERAEQPLALLDLYRELDRIAQQPRRADRKRFLFALLERLSRVEVWCLMRILQGETRLGASRGLLLRAIARAADSPAEDAERTFLLIGDLAEVAARFVRGERSPAKLELFRPVPFMLASPLPSLRLVPDEDPTGWIVEDKYDGIRAQLHADGGEVELYSRSLHAIGGQFPEIVRAGRSFRSRVILDGEIVAFRHGRVLPFQQLQRRLGRVGVPAHVLRDVPCRLFVFDILHLDGADLLETPLAERRQQLEALVGGDYDAITVAPAQWLRSRGDIERKFHAALDRGNEGIMLKRPESVYTPGTRGQQWLKYKVPFATLDCVVVAAEYGHGKRAGWLSDYLFAVRDGDRLVTIAKAYSGLNDEEIAALTEHFRTTTIRRDGPVHWVEPTVVMELGFESIQPSDRHTSGFALRFPRILRIRIDKTVREIDTLDRVRELYEMQRRGDRPLAGEQH